MLLSNTLVLLLLAGHHRLLRSVRSSYSSISEPALGNLSGIP